MTRLLLLVLLLVLPCWSKPRKAPHRGRGGERITVRDLQRAATPPKALKPRFRIGYPNPTLPGMEPEPPRVISPRPYPRGPANKP